MEGRGDPKVTGVLPIALGRARNVLQHIIHSDKTYVCVMTLHEAVPEDKIREVCREFVGDIYQKPPLKASVERRLRVRRIFSIEVQEIIGRLVLMVIHCEAGTYIRKLCHDIGEVLGVGAHMAELRRIHTGPFTEDENLVTMHELHEAVIALREYGDEKLLRKVILPVEYAVRNLPKIYIRDSAVDSICHGAPLAAPGVLHLTDDVMKGGLVAIMTLKGELVAIARALMRAHDMFEASQGIVAKPVRVIMKPGTYPRHWKSSKFVGKG
ncbi:MAG: RNA-guided pseudouridylation complex pseudouridine synthase subunit Cbf5 [Candidatus Bathyarchaeia archaeon]